MRVTFVQRPDAAMYCGGGEVQAARTAEELQRLGVAVDVLTPLSTELGNLVHFFGVLADYACVAEHCRQQGVPYVCSPIFYIGNRWREVAAWRARASLPGMYAHHRRRVLDGAALLLPNSQAEADQVRRVFRQPPSKMHVTPNGVEAAFAEGDPRAFPEAFGIGEPYVLHTGRLEPRKNQLRLVRALRGTGLRLVIIGRDGDSGYAEACRRAADENVTFLPPLPHGDPLLASAYAACRVFALPSLLETPGISALEAAAAGARVVTTPIGGGREYFGSSALYVAPLSEADIRSKVLRAWGEERPGRRQGEQVLARFSWRAVADRTLAGYWQVLGSATQGA